MKTPCLFSLCIILILDRPVSGAKKDMFRIEKQSKEEIKNITSSSDSREQRLVLHGLFSLVSFPNLDCAADNGYNGTCLSGSECIGRGGRASGSCAQGFGICCFLYVTACGGTITRNRTFFQNPNFPEPYTVSTETTCSYTFTKCCTNVCQLRLDFETFELSELGRYDTDAIAGNGNIIIAVCTRTALSTDAITSDTMKVTHADGLSEDVVFCGINTGYHIYLDMGADGTQTDTTKVEFILDSTNYGSTNRKWNIMATQIECSALSRAPDGCLQYHYGNMGSGVLETFNYKETDTNKIGHLSGKYSVCVRREKDRCVMGVTPPKVAVDSYGWSVSAPAPSQRSRGTCSNNEPAQGCGIDMVQILQATILQSGAGPFAFKIETPTAICTNPANDQTRCYICDRFCGKRLGVFRGSQGGEHAVLYTRHAPFQINVSFNPEGHIQDRLNKGFKLNYFQMPC